ncbi:hypothetical protein [Virgisporangium aliadipatigenens]|uniref:hypothetical protein n=1 Tax=Virgisporangium aliadipatigenens TaxID=741659 RepID=UPI0019442E1F|nr:hypothetical protein [Virgisporangium aliadipatigenens]
MDPPVVTLICGASGVGKTSVARPLAMRWGVPLAEADDVVTALLALTTPQSHPVLHRSAMGRPPEEIVAHLLAVSAALAPGFRAVVADHVTFRQRVVMEGDWLTPDLVAGIDGAGAVVIGEPDEDRIAANYLRREPDAGPQPERARVSVLHGAALAAAARAAGVPVVPAWPFDTALDRVERAIFQAA